MIKISLPAKIKGRLPSGKTEDRRPFFKYGKHVERLHSASNVFVYTKHRWHCKMLVGNIQTLELHPRDAGLLKNIKINF